MSYIFDFMTSFVFFFKEAGDFPGGPVAKTLSYQCRGPRGQSPVKELRFHMLQLRPGIAK